MTQRKLIRIRDLATALACHESQAWRMIKADPNAPKPIRISPRYTAFDSEQADAWIIGLIKTANCNPAKQNLPDADAIRRGALTRKARRSST